MLMYNLTIVSTLSVAFYIVLTSLIPGLRVISYTTKMILDQLRRLMIMHDHLLDAHCARCSSAVQQQGIQRSTSIQPLKYF